MPLIDKVDLVMWTKNGAQTLQPVLKRINQVIPAEAVNQRLIVDDQSTDNTPELALSSGWRVVPNEGKGISDGANTALRHVETEHFVSFEQDLLLAQDWWRKIPPCLSDPKVAVASGIRFNRYPEVVKRIQEYTAEGYRSADKPSHFLPYVKSLDNTIYRTRVIRDVGGFPKMAMSVGIDHLLSQKIFMANWKWKVDYSVHSVHLRKGLRNELEHNYWYGTHADELERALFQRNIDTHALLRRVLLSPVRGLQIAVKKRAPEAVYVYPLMRMCLLSGVFAGRRAS
jgi:glycosyltransferase involved in cell wall biosynthesis